MNLTDILKKKKKAVWLVEVMDCCSQVSIFMGLNSMNENHRT